MPSSGSPSYGKKSPRRQKQRALILRRRAMRPIKVAVSENTHYFVSRNGSLFESITFPPSPNKEGRVEIFQLNMEKKRELVGTGFFQPSPDGQSIHLSWVEKRSIEIKRANPRFKVKDRGIDLARPVIDACVREARKRGLKCVTLEAYSSLESYYSRFGFRTIARNHAGNCSMVLAL